MSARDVIAEKFYQACRNTQHDPLGYADQTVALLTAAGYRLLAPGELDAATIEACTEAVSQVKPIPALSGPPWEPQTRDFVATLRNLGASNG